MKFPKQKKSISNSRYFLSAVHDVAGMWESENPKTLHKRSKGSFPLSLLLRLRMSKRRASDVRTSYQESTEKKEKFKQFNLLSFDLYCAMLDFWILIVWWNKELQREMGIGWVWEDEWDWNFSRDTTERAATNTRISPISLSLSSRSLPCEFWKNSTLIVSGGNLD